MTLGVCGRADLVRALAQGDVETSAALAALLGYHYAARPEPVPDLPLPETTSERRTEAAAPETAGHDAIDVPFWRLESYQALTYEAPAVEVVKRPVAKRREAPAARAQPLSPPHVLLARLRQLSEARRPGREFDTEAAVAKLSRGEWLSAFPTRQQRAWGSELFIIKDRARRLTPYWGDQDDVVRLLRRLYPTDGLHVARHARGELEPVAPWPGPLPAEVALQSSARVLALTDLGCLATPGQEAAYEFWLYLGRYLREREIPAIALVPTHPQAVAPELARLWTLARWDASSAATLTALSPEVIGGAVDRLLTLLAPAIRLEPGLVRAIRYLLPEGQQDAGLEARLWQHEAIANPHSVAASWDPERRHAYQARFAGQSQADRQAAIDCIRSWRHDLHPAIWHEELLGLDDASKRDLSFEGSELSEAVGFLSEFAKTVWQAGDAGADTEAWASGVLKRLPHWAYANEAVREASHYLYDLVRPPDDNAPVPQWYNPGVLPPPPDQPVRQVSLWQVGREIQVRMYDPSHRNAMQPPGSPLGVIHTANGELVIAGRHEQPFWPSDAPPSWAHDWGDDASGAWASFRVGDVEQRMRWIAPGRFWMGSPEDEEGRFSDEGPRHEVELSEGFWLFDTPCTQGLWQVVMGENPSHFRGSNRPVETVSWDDCQAFISKVNEQRPGLELRLPTEAQWEYACRAGTTGARYDGDLDAIAWYDGNSRNETCDVAQKRPNAWGLYDMLGNVWEWCHDGLRAYAPELLVDPVGSTEAGANRALRGGLWFSIALNVRAALRYANDPSHRDSLIGFRCLSAGREPERARGAWGELEQRAGSAETTSHQPVARLLSVQEPSGLATAFPDASVTEIYTNHERLRFSRIIRPSWACAIGRDAYGLWVRIEVEGVAQRLRWLNPGRFWMGSPEDENGHLPREGPRHEVELSEGFWLFDTPCTQGLWEAVMGENPSRCRSAQRPVETVSWDACQAFISKVNEQHSGLELCLPTEAQWEYACRAGMARARYDEGLDAIAWYGGNSGGDTHDVGQKRPNVWGLYDMLGNVYEWCHDGRRDYAPGLFVDPVGPTETGAHRVVRGGSWFDPARFARSANRYRYEPGDRYDNLGFRCLSLGVS